MSKSSFELCYKKKRKYTNLTKKWVNLLRKVNPVKKAIKGEVQSQ